jgi:hypothetical protein
VCSSDLFNQTPTAKPVLNSQTNPIITGSILGSDPNDDLLAYTVTQGPANGSVLVDSAGNFTYTANADLALIQITLDPSSQRYSTLAIQFKNHLRSFLMQG